jgi:RNA recognition motif-containing protein
MSKKLYVGNLSWNTTVEGLREAFEPHGEILDAVIIMDRYTGRSRGFGFVTMADDEAADKAIAALDGTSLDDRNIKVNVARERSRGEGRGGGGGGGGDRRW